MKELTWKVAEVIAAFDSGGYAVFPSRTATKEEADDAVKAIEAMSICVKLDYEVRVFRDGAYEITPSASTEPCPYTKHPESPIKLSIAGLLASLAQYARNNAALASDLEGRGEG